MKYTFKENIKESKLRLPATWNLVFLNNNIQPVGKKYWHLWRGICYFGQIEYPGNIGYMFCQIEFIRIYLVDIVLIGNMFANMLYQSINSVSDWYPKHGKYFFLDGIKRIQVLLVKINVLFKWNISSDLIFQ